MIAPLLALLTFLSGVLLWKRGSYLTAMFGVVLMIGSVVVGLGLWAISTVE